MNRVLAAQNPTSQFLMLEYLSKMGGEHTPPSLL